MADDKTPYNANDVLRLLLHLSPDPTETSTTMGALVEIARASLPFIYGGRMASTAVQNAIERDALASAFLDLLRANAAFFGTKETPNA